MSDPIVSLQGTPEWIAARIGKVTASRISDMMAKTKSGWGASRKNYAAELLAERLTAQAAEGYVSFEMKRGIELEPEARAAYEWYRDETVELTGFVAHPRIALSGASPDGLVGKDGLVEFKCPNTATHVATLLGGEISNDYILQCQFQMACTGRKWDDWVSYDPRLPEHMRLFVRRVPRDEEKIAEIEREVQAFIAEIDETVNKLAALYPHPLLKEAA